MRLTKTSLYAIKAISHIAMQKGDRPIHGRDIAEACFMPKGHLLKILQRIARAGILLSGRGASGGFRLARPPDKITMLDILEAVDGTLIHHQPLGPDTCFSFPGYPLLQDSLDKITHSARIILSKLTIAELFSQAKTQPQHSSQKARTAFRNQPLATPSPAGHIA
ncbi:MAG: Rrf2 family transcriptional regulator [Planctomycetota bacterium]